MPKYYRRKPVVMRAVQLLPENLEELAEFVTLPTFKPTNVPDNDNRLYAIIETLEGPMMATHGDFIVRGVKGEYWAVKPDVFVECYELVEQPRVADAYGIL